MIIIGVRFKKVGKIYYFDPNGQEFKSGENVVVETARGVELGQVVLANRDIEDSELESTIKKIIRKATQKDIAQKQENKQKEIDASAICEEKIKKHKLEMKLITTEYTFDRTKIIFYFTADGRVDFRELVKNLAAIFKTRIELRQIGVRDKSKMVGGIGMCGRTLCCATHLDDFGPVSINMAKDQGLSLNPVKISGSCGRLMCCLRYEQEVYEELNATIPPVDSTVRTPDGKGIVVENHILKGKVKVKVENSDVLKEYDAKKVKVLRAPRRNNHERIDPEIAKLAKD